MKNNFISTLSFHKRPINFPKSFPQEPIIKTNINDPEQIDKNLKPRLQNRVNKSDRTIYTTKTSQKTTPHQSQLSSSLHELDIQKLQTLQPIMAYSPIKSQRSSPSSAKENSSANQKNPNLKNMQFLPIRSTLKNNTASRSPPTDSNITKEADYMHSHRQRYPPLYQLKMENQRLQQENAFLKRELGQIKKNLIFGPAIKKEEPDNSLKESLKKQNSENFELRLKLELFTKKSKSLECLVDSKEEEISFLKSKLHRIEEDLRRYKHQNCSELDILQEKIADVLKSYQDLEIKMVRQEADELLYRERWQEEKNLYKDRITFLQHYIAHNT